MLAFIKRVHPWSTKKAYGVEDHRLYGERSSRCSCRNRLGPLESISRPRTQLFYMELNGGLHNTLLNVFLPVAVWKYLAKESMMPQSDLRTAGCSMWMMFFLSMKDNRCIPCMLFCFSSLIGLPSVPLIQCHDGKQGCKWLFMLQRVAHYFVFWVYVYFKCQVCLRVFWTFAE